MVTSFVSSTAMPMTASLNPGITRPPPIMKVRGALPTEVSKTVPFRYIPVYSTVTLSPGAAVCRSGVPVHPAARISATSMAHPASTILDLISTCLGLRGIKELVVVRAAGVPAYPSSRRTRPRAREK
jgi:hypothetical protein